MSKCPCGAVHHGTGLCRECERDERWEEAFDAQFDDERWDDQDDGEEVP